MLSEIFLFVAFYTKSNLLFLGFAGVFVRGSCDVLEE